MISGREGKGRGIRTEAGHEGAVFTSEGAVTEGVVRSCPKITFSILPAGR